MDYRFVPIDATPTHAHARKYICSQGSSELYSPPRVCAAALKVGLKPGMSFDLTELDPEDNMPWDFTLKSKRERAKEHMRKERPFLLIGCPAYRAFSTFFSNNISNLDPNQVRDIISEGISHLEFCCELYRLQSEEGRLFLHEHPLSAWSRRWPCIAEVLRLPGVRRVRGDMCAHNMIITDKVGPAKAFKPTGWMSNSTLILNELNKLCSNNG